MGHLYGHGVSKKPKKLSSRSLSSAMNNPGFVRAACHLSLCPLGVRLPSAATHSLRRVDGRVLSPWHGSRHLMALEINHPELVNRINGEVPFYQVITLPSMAIRPRRDGLGSTTSSLNAELIHDATYRGH